MFVGAAMTETGGKNKICLETMFTEEREGGKM
jgi:hypothetical protein